MELAETDFTEIPKGCILRIYLFWVKFDGLRAGWGPKPNSRNENVQLLMF